MLRQSFPDDVSIGIVSYNGVRSGHLARCIEACLRTGCPMERLTVADVASSDASIDWLAANHPQIHVIAMPDNLGPNPARNALIDQARTPLLLLLDVDTYPAPQAPAMMRKAMGEDTNIAAVVPTIVYEDDPTQVLCAYSWLHFLGEASALHRDVPIDSVEHDQLQVVNVPGASPLIRVDIAKAIGGYDPNMFFGKEDGDFAYRLAISGYRAIHLKHAVATHPRGRRGARFIPHQISNRWYLMLKSYQWRTILATLPASLVHEFVILIFACAKGMPTAHCRALRMLWQRRKALMTLRKQTQHQRVLADVQLLRGDHMVLPPAKLGRALKLDRLYDTCMSTYWSVARGLLRLMPGSHAQARPQPTGPTDNETHVSETRPPRPTHVIEPNA